ncbi:hypothetical protein H480_30291 [Amycolatopsis vancoresmycina DSM 44592]|uniref:Lipoprotein n=1 Tax=Amycolatopsis vancoresmycina DSM 44592 TaxID=1292037 RepID=R1FZG7_9PSEU|nr:hypothetical protein H480_30291 [Amycolatopsis vancoresmycina DSM 44592]
MSIATAALVLAACDPGPGGTPPTAPATLTAPVTDIAQLVAAARAGIAEAPSATFGMAAVLGTDTKESTGSLSFDGRTSSLTMVVDGSEVRVIGRKTFTHTASLPGKEWIGTDPDSTDPILRAAGAAVPVIVKLPDLGRALEEIERTGRLVSADQTRLEAGPVNHYVLELDAAKAPELFPEFAEPPVDGKPAKITTAKLPAELWLDAARRPVRFAVDLTAGAPAGAHGDPTLRATTDYRDWGKPVDIQPPPADQVVDLGELMKKMGT